MSQDLEGGADFLLIQSRLEQAEQQAISSQQIRTNANVTRGLASPELGTPDLVGVEGWNIHRPIVRRIAISLDDTLYGLLRLPADGWVWLDRDTPQFKTRNRWRIVEV